MGVKSISLAELELAADDYHRRHGREPANLLLDSQTYVEFMNILKETEFKWYSHIAVVLDNSVKRFKYTGN